MKIEPIKIKKIDRKKFDAYVSHTRHPYAEFFSREIDYYSNNDESILGLLSLDNIDRDFSAAIFCRDTSRKFRAIDVITSEPNKEDAENWIIRTIKWHTAQNLRILDQGDDQKGVNLFSPVVEIEKQHIYFKQLNSDIAFEPAKKIINEITPHFIDIDGNYVEQFQTTGFDARLWELYLFCYFNEDRFLINRDYDRPDFIVEKGDLQFCIEAVTTGRKKGNEPKFFKNISYPSISDIKHKSEIETPLIFGSALYSKLQKEYWKLPQCKDKPIIIAIADFHDDISMTWSSTSLLMYLYGYKHDFTYNNKGELKILPKKLNFMKPSGAEVPPFFFQENADNISAVLFSSTGTISKFNRIGIESGFGNPNIIVRRMGSCHNHDANASVPLLFDYIVSKKSNETWAEGLNMFHNPNAKNPIDKDYFPSIAHHDFKNGNIVSLLPEFYPYNSFTMHIKIDDEK